MERVLDILYDEFRRCMMLTGCRDIWISQRPRLVLFGRMVPWHGYELARWSTVSFVLSTDFVGMT